MNWNIRYAHDTRGYANKEWGFAPSSHNEGDFPLHEAIARGLGGPLVDLGYCSRREELGDCDRMPGNHEHTQQGRICLPNSSFVNSQRIMHEVSGRPDSPVTITRGGIPLDAENRINPYDWVSLDKGYIDSWMRHSGNPSQVSSLVVPAKHVFVRPPLEGRERFTTPQLKPYVSMGYDPTRG